METAPKKVNITGLDATRMIGMEDVYQRSLNQERAEFNQKYFSDMYNRMSNLDKAVE